MSDFDAFCTSGSWNEHSIVYLLNTAWLHHSSVTLHVTKVYFLELLLRIKGAAFWR